jgi:hypothetical protein
MKAPENNKWLDELLIEAIGSGKSLPHFEKWQQNHPEAVEMLTSRASRQSPAVARPLNIRKTIMKSPITKLAAAAVIILAVVLSITFLDKSVIPVAYALEQTIQASHTVRCLHTKNFVTSHDEPMEFWVEFGPSGQLKNMRFNKPAWMTPDDGATVIVWKDNKMQMWIEKKNMLATLRDKEIAEQALKAMEQLDPKLAVERLQREQEQGKAKIEIEEPANKAEPIVVTATSAKEDDSPFQRVVLFVDQATRLVNAVELYALKDGEYYHEATIEYYDYNQPIDAKMFTLDNLPDDVMKIDQTTQGVGLAQGNLTDKEIAVEVVHQFLEALINKDYAKAGRLFSGVPAERMQKTYGQIRFIRIISIGEPTKHALTGELKVPCKIEIERDGQITIWEPEHSYVRQVHGQPNRWEITGGFLGI